MYHLLNTIYIQKHTIAEKSVTVVYLNTTHCQEQIGKYLLQAHGNTMKESIQEVTHIMRNRNNNTESYDCDMSAVWNFDGVKTWYSVFFKDSDSRLDFSQYADYKVKDNGRVSFTLDGCQSSLPQSNI
jgi:hypothetical protein